MDGRVLALGLAVLLSGGCQHGGTDAAALAASPVSPASLTAAADARPWKAHVDWTVVGVQWAGMPGQAKSLFDGRCSVLSDYVVSATFAGEATHAGRVTGESSHCTQIDWSPAGQPLTVAYTDGLGSLVSANGSRMSMRYGNGTTGFDADTGETWFQDDFTLIGETGLFAGATGSGKEGGRFLDFGALLAGAPTPMWQEGTITYDPRRH